MPKGQRRRVLDPTGPGKMVLDSLYGAFDADYLQRQGETYFHQGKVTEFNVTWNSVVHARGDSPWSSPVMKVDAILYGTTDSRELEDPTTGKVNRLLEEPKIVNLALTGLSKGEKDALTSDCGDAIAKWLSGDEIAAEDVLECVRNRGHSLWPARLMDHPVEYHRSLQEVSCTCPTFLPRRPNPFCTGQTLRPRWCKHVAAAWYKLAFHLQDHPKDLLLMSGFTMDDFRIQRPLKRSHPSSSHVDVIDLTED